MPRFAGWGSAASGSAKAILNLHNAQASPAKRAKIYDILVGSVATPADLAASFGVNRTTAVGTEDAGFTPVPLDPADPATEWDFGVGFSGGEPTKTANAVLLQFSMNQRATFRWVAAPGSELVLPATQNNGACIQTISVSSGTTAYEATILFEE